MKGSDLWRPVVPWGQLFGDLLQMGWVQEHLDGASVYVTRKTSLPLLGVLEQKPCESWPKYGALEEHKNIQMVPRLSLQLCTAEWQVQQKTCWVFHPGLLCSHINSKLSSLSSSRVVSGLHGSAMALSAGLASAALHTVSFNVLFILTLFFPPLSNLASTHAEASDWWGKREVKQLKMALCANCFVH